jgi:hypothetical protein
VGIHEVLHAMGYRVALGKRATLFDFREENELTPAADFLKTIRGS